MLGGDSFHLSGYEMLQSDIALSGHHLHFGYEARGMLRIFICVIFDLECFDVNKHMSNISHKAKGLDRNRCRNKKGSLSLGSYQAAKNSVFSVLREARNNDRTFVT